METDYSAYLIARQRITELQAEARAYRLARAARRARTPAPLPDVAHGRAGLGALRARFAARRNRTAVTHAAPAAVVVEGVTR